jgi:hypothetical protein
VRQAIALYDPINDHFSEAGCQTEMAADPARDHSGMREAFRTAAFPVADTGGMDQRYISGMAVLQKPRLQRHRELFRPTGKHNGTGADNGPILNKCCSCFRR